MISRIRRTLQSLGEVYRGWRLILAAGILLPILLIALLYPRDERIVVAVLLLVAVASLLVLHGLDVRRQDRLRAKYVPRPMPAATGTVEAVQRRPVPSRWVPDVTVVVTAHNEDDWLVQCLESVANQTWSDFECIVVDDLSTDDTLAKAFDAFQSDPRFRFVHNEVNLGLAGSRNVGLSMARGRWITFLDGDDFLYEEALAARIDAVSKHQNDPFVVGAYCGWHSVDEYAAPGMEGPKPTKDRSDVTWFDATYDAPFIASAPMIDINVARTLGGFDETLNTAEDFEFWSRLLRQGYVIVWAPLVGVAYRQRRDSMYRVTSAAHAAITSDVYRRNQAVLPENAEEIGPFLFREPAHVYQTRLATARRLLTGYVAAEAADDAEASATLWSDLEEVAEPWMKWASLSSVVLSKTALRIESYQTDGAKARASVLDHRLRPRIQRLFASNAARVSSTAYSRVVAPATSIEMAVPQMGSGPQSTWNSDTVLLMPSAAYHCDELGPLAREVEEAGLNAAFAVIPKRLKAVSAELRKYPFPVTVIEPDDPNPKAVAKSVAALVTLNDWGDYDRFVLAGNEAGIPTFGKVEGVQDFTDADVHWERRAYQQVGHVLCQGQNDIEGTTGQRSIVGSTRLERIWHHPPVSSKGRRVVINLNFTYGVLDEARDEWLSTTIEACRRAGIDWEISLHPAQRPPEGIANIATKPMRYLLTKPAILVSRFSTVPFEAMARGVPFVYHNPHGEKVPTFKDPDGAYEVTSSVAELTGALTSARNESDYRARSERFFRRQIDVDPDRTSEARTIEVIRAALGGR